MKIYFNNVCFYYRNFIKKVFLTALKELDNNFQNIIINLSFKSQEEIRQLNKTFRNVDRATDVLSFPFLEIKYGEKVADFKEDINPDGTIDLGDIVICKQVAKKQAKEYKHSLKREIAFLSLHGLLHLLGYDHIEKKDEIVMNQCADKILNKLKIKRG